MERSGRQHLPGGHRGPQRRQRLQEQPLLRPLPQERFPSLEYVDQVRVDDKARARVKAASYIRIARLNAAASAATGPGVTIPFPGRIVESPALFRRANTYYLVVSDPSCGYCSGTGSAWLSAPSPLGPWSYGGKFSSTSCGGQPAAVTQIGQSFPYQSDLWQAGNRNQAQADQWSSLLDFYPDGGLGSIDCTRGAFPLQAA